jgi:leader peptidase (prepilin peptidase) / N-methyltransferase
LLASRLEIQSGIWTHTEVEMSQDALRIGDATFNPEAVSRMEVVTDALVVPREAMGFGDVKFMGAIGAFLGWQATIFSLVASSFIGATVGVMLILMRQRQLTAKLPYGPYIALAAVIWMFWGRAIMQAAENWMQM